MKIETPVMKATPYEPPHMTVVPLRTSGAMLIGSMVQYELLDLRSNFQAASDYDEGFSSESFGTASDWGDNFFSASPAE